MKRPFHIVAGILALTSAAQLNAAQTAQCLSRGEVHDLIAYVLPDAISSTTTGCSASLPADSYLTVKGPALADEFKAGKNAAWPGAKAAFMKIANQDGKDNTLSTVSDELLRGILDGVMAEKLGELKIKPSTCGDISRLSATLAPMPAENVIQMTTELVAVVARNDKDFKLCIAE